MPLSVTVPPLPTIGKNEGDLVLAAYRAAYRSQPPRWVAPRTLWGSLGDTVAISVVCDDIAKLRSGTTGAQLLTAHLAELSNPSIADQASWQEYTTDLAAFVALHPVALVGG